MQFSSINVYIINSFFYFSSYSHFCYCFSFPNNPYRAAKWVAIVATERAEEFYKPTKNSVICSEHFDFNDIIGNTERRRLDKSAVPKFKVFQRSCFNITFSVSARTHNSRGNG